MLVWVVAVAGQGCRGDDRHHGQPHAFDPPLVDDSAPLVAWPMHRLDRREYHHTVHDLLGDALPADFDVRTKLPTDDEHGGFLANTTVPMTPLGAEQLEDAARSVVDAVLPRRAQLHPCFAEAEVGATCSRAWIDAIGPRAFRRPLDDDVREALHSLVEPVAVASGVDADPIDDAVTRGLLALLQAPDFVYRIERGEPTEDADVVQLNDFEIAARLSYLLWSSMPDAELWAQAEAGLLRDPVERDRATVRMLDDPRARRGLAAFHRQWLELGRLSGANKDRIRFPTFDEALLPLLDEEFEIFIDLVLRQGDGTVDSLLRSRVIATHPALAPFYGDDASPHAADVEVPPGWSVVVLDPERRAGVLTLVSTMAAHGKADRSDPVGRGALVRRRLLCETLAAAPPEAMMASLVPVEGASQREQLRQHAEDPSCAGCHALTDPAGLMFEHYDAMGGYRAEDFAGNPIDARGRLPGSDIEGELPDAVALAQALATSGRVRRCYAAQWLRRAVGRPETDGDAALLAMLERQAQRDGGHVPTLLRALVASESFVHRRSEP